MEGKKGNEWKNKVKFAILELYDIENLMTMKKELNEFMGMDF